MPPLLPKCRPEGGDCQLRGMRKDITKTMHSLTYGVEKSKIPLPADIDGNPDYKYMENYVATKLSMTENALNKLMVCV